MGDGESVDVFSGKWFGNKSISDVQVDAELNHLSPITITQFLQLLRLLISKDRSIQKQNRSLDLSETRIKKQLQGKS